jgi:hypothetical protein
MKNKIISLLFVALCSPFLNSCNKYNEQIGTTPTKNITIKNTRTIDRICYLDGSLTTLESLDWDNNLIAFDRGDSHPLYVFTNQNNFTTWVATQPEADAVLEKNAKLLALRKFVVDNDIEEITESTGVIPEVFINYMQTHIDPNWHDPRNEPQGIVGNGVGWTLHDKINQAGAWRLGVQNNPNYKWMNFNNMTSSLGGIYAGVMPLCDYTWWGGTYYWIVSGPPFTLATSFSILPFNDKASSNL